MIFFSQVVVIAFTLNWFLLQDGPVSIQEKFEYIMYGTVYDIKPDGLSLSPPEVYVNVSHVILLYLSVLLHFILIRNIT
jgi:hypothetical protein